MTSIPVSINQLRAWQSRLSWINRDAKSGLHDLAFLIDEIMRAVLDSENLECQLHISDLKRIKTEVEVTE